MARDSVRNPIIVGDKVEIPTYHQNDSMSKIYKIVKIDGKFVELINDENERIRITTSRIKRI